MTDLSVPRVIPSSATDARQLVAEMRERINPAYAYVLGTESYERRLSCEAIEALLKQEQRLEWLIKRSEYLEHSGPNGELCRSVDIGSFWPQHADGENVDEDMTGLSFIEYVDAQIAIEARHA